MMENRTFLLDHLEEASINKDSCSGCQKPDSKVVCIAACAHPLCDECVLTARGRKNLCPVENCKRSLEGLIDPRNTQALSSIPPPPSALSVNLEEVKTSSKLSCVMNELRSAINCADKVTSLALALGLEN